MSTQREERVEHQKIQMFPSPGNVSVKGPSLCKLTWLKIYKYSGQIYSGQSQGAIGKDEGLVVIK
jgi:hypothetical protein